jgi:sugar phosphate isomerase/epimerase
MKTGIQVSSLKPLLTTTGEVHEAFRKMADLGSGPVQLQWIDPAVPLEEVAGALKENRMISVSVQDFYQLVKDNFGYYVNLNEATGGVWLCVSRIPEDRKSPEGLDLFIGELREMQKKLDPYGQKLCFHPVTGDFQAVPGMNAVEYLFDRMPEMEICLDLYHLNRNCADMPGFIRRYAGRVPMVHFKDSWDGKLVPAGQGQVNWTGVAEACLEAGVEYGFVEQETWDRDPYDCLGEALAWLRQEIEAVIK